MDHVMHVKRDITLCNSVFRRLTKGQLNVPINVTEYLLIPLLVYSVGFRF